MKKRTKEKFWKFCSGVLDVTASLAVCLTEGAKRDIHRIERSHGSRMTKGQRNILNERISIADNFAERAHNWSERRKGRNK